jgi:catechol 2,3-dioxygenase-like lactoylglutathione lyase family enzyme
MRSLAFALTLALIAPTANAQAPAVSAPPGPSPTGLVVGSGNFFSPIVADLDRAVAFYRDGLGLDVQGAPANADTNPALRNMFGLPGAQLRWLIGRPAGMRSGVEMVEIKKADGRALERRLQDIGAFTLIVLVRDIDSVFGRLTQLGAPVVTKGGAPVFVPGGARKSRAVIVKDPDGHFVELFQPDPLPDAPTTPAPNVIEVRVRLAVADVDRETRLYRDALGLAVRAPGEFARQPSVLDMMGLPADAEYRASMFTVPTTGLTFELIDFKGVDRRVVRGNIQDPGSTRMQLQVRDVGATIAALTQAGGTVVSAGGTTVELPGRGGATTRVAIVREPSNLFLVLLEATTAAPRPR